MLPYPKRKERPLTENELDEVLRSEDYVKLPAAYQILHRLTGMYYVGSTDDYMLRQYNHRYCLRRGIHPNKPLMGAYHQDPEIHWFAYITQTYEEAVEMEQEWLDNYLPLGILFNIASDARRPAKGAICSAEHKAAIAAGSSAAHRNKIVPLETRFKIGLKNRGQVRSEEALAKIRAPRGDYNRPVAIEGVTYPNLKTAAEAVGLPYWTLYRRLHSSYFPEWIRIPSPSLGEVSGF
jgi:hypothetical protein